MRAWKVGRAVFSFATPNRPRRAALVAALSCLLAALTARAQPSSLRPRLYLDCGRDCSDSFYRQKLNYFDWVRDRHQADFAFSVVTQEASNGADSYTITLRQPSRPDRGDLVRVITAEPQESLANIRVKLLDAELRLLFDALRGTPYESTFTLALPQRSEQVIGEVVDGWDHWVFTPELMAELEAESNYYNTKLTGEISIRRITEVSKFLSSSKLLWRRTSFTFGPEEGGTQSGSMSSVEQRLVYARSIGHHWALGAIAAGEHDEFENLKLHLRGGPVLEWNLFPYEENASRQLRFAYQAGAWYTRYFERTAFGRRHDLRPYHALSCIVDVNQAWGGIQAVLQANSFIDAPKLWRLSSGVIFALNLVAGLALQFEGEAAFIQDQIALRGRELTEPEVYLSTRELAKNFSITAQFGFSYTFGSVHNTIVNPRFGRVDLEDN